METVCPFQYGGDNIKYPFKRWPHTPVFTGLWCYTKYPVRPFNWVVAANAIFWHI